MKVLEQYRTAPMSLSLDRVPCLDKNLVMNSTIFLLIFIYQSLLTLQLVVLDAEFNSESNGDNFKGDHRERKKGI
jgi:hypothetical protein